MEIHVSNIDTSKTTVLTGHKAPILGVALDPKDKYVVSKEILYCHCFSTLLWNMPLAVSKRIRKD
jgi:hypothetical protein